MNKDVDEFDYYFKIILIGSLCIKISGDSGVGKSNILL